MTPAQWLFRNWLHTEASAAITLLVNGYAVAHLSRRSLGAFPVIVQNFPWPESLHKRSAPWSALLVNAASIGIDEDPDTYTYWQLDFGDTPPKLGGRPGAVQLMKPRLL